MKTQTDWFEFETEGTVELEKGEILSDVPDIVFGRISSRVGDVEVNSFTAKVMEDEDGQIIEYSVVGRVHELDL